MAMWAQGTCLEDFLEKGFTETKWWTCASFAVRPTTWQSVALIAEGEGQRQQQQEGEAG